MPYYDNFWHKDAYENIPSPACLTFFVRLKTENQLIRFEAASDWNVIENPAMCHWSGNLSNGEFALMHVSKPKQKHCEHMLWSFVPQLSQLNFHNF